MRKSTRIVKRIFALLLVVLMSINTLGAVVSDNDGSAFITKAEFDSLKNNFQSQIDQYNTSIDSKIDGAIASYLAGIRLSKKNVMTLDRNCNYAFPLVMFSDWTGWTNIGSDYYNVSVPQVKTVAPHVWTRSINSGGSETTIRNGNWKVAASDVPYKSAWGYMVGFGNVDQRYDGRNGYLNEIQRTTNYRNVDGTNRTIWKLINEGSGQYIATFFNDIKFHTSANTQSGTKGSRYAEYAFVGVRNGTNFRNSNTSGDRNVYWIETDARTVWTNKVLQYATGGHTIKPTAADTATVNLPTTITNMEDLVDAINSTWAWEAITQNHYYDQETIYDHLPDAFSTSWEHLNYRKAVYYGNALMPANIEKNWGLIANDTTDASKYKFSLSRDINRGPTRWLLYRSVDSGWPAYVYYSDQPTREVWPEWKIKLYNNFEQETNNDFSAIRASVVSYEDSNGKTHFMDEGMYLGKYNGEGKVEFVIKFNGATGKRVNFVLSKKPFGFDHSDSDNIKFKFKVTTDSTSSPIEIANGGYGYIDTNYFIRVEVDDIEKNDELYMIWWPNDGPGTYVELDNITDYYFETTT